MRIYRTLAQVDIAVSALYPNATRDKEKWTVGDKVVAEARLTDGGDRWRLNLLGYGYTTGVIQKGTP
jgi:hypothetical protein